MSAAFVKGDVFPYVIGFGKACFKIAEFKPLFPMDIAGLSNQPDCENAHDDAY